MLKNRGYYSDKKKDETCSEVDAFLHQVRFWKVVDWAGELAGWSVGKNTIGGLEVLVTRGRQPVVPKKGDYPHLRTFLRSLLGQKQLPYFLGWLKGSLDSLKEGCPFRPGQMIAFCGPVDCGKSFAQKLVTEILGGRQGDPTQFLLGEEKQNGDFLKAEHLLIEDKALKDFSHAKRRAFAANLKGMIVNSDQRIRCMFKDAVLLPVCMRLTLSCNDAPEALAILPALDSDVQDKVIYFLCGLGELPMRKKRQMTRSEQQKLLFDEVPALVYWLHHWKIPPTVLDPKNRFTVREYHHPEIVDRLLQLTPEERLLHLLQVLPVQWPPSGIMRGNAFEIEGWMRAADKNNQMDRLITYTAQMGTLLAKISREGEERIRIVKSSSKHLCYEICRDEL